MSTGIVKAFHVLLTLQRSYFCMASALSPAVLAAVSLTLGTQTPCSQRVGREISLQITEFQVLRNTSFDCTE